MIKKNIFLIALFILLQQNTFSINSTNDLTNDIIIKNPDNIKIELINDANKKNTDLFSSENLIKLREILTIIGIILGIIFGYFAIIKNLKFENIKNQINKFQVKQAEVQKICYDQLSKFLIKTNDIKWIELKDIKEMLDSAIELDNVLFNSSKETATLSLLLKTTYFRFYEYIKSENNPIVHSNLYTFYVNIINDILAFSLKIISFPSLFELIRYTKKISMYDKKLNSYTRNENYKILNYYQLGAELDPLGKQVISFFSSVNSIRNIFLNHSCFRIFNSHIPIIRLLNYAEIYFPPILKSKEKNIEGNYDKYFMIGYNSVNRISKFSEKIIIFYYVTEVDNIILSDTLDLKKLFDGLEDDFIIENNKKINIVPENFKKETQNIFSFELKYTDCLKYFKIYKLKISKKMKKEKKENI